MEERLTQLAVEGSIPFREGLITKTQLLIGFVFYLTKLINNLYYRDIK